MGVNDEHLHPWLRAEKRFIESMIARERTVLGICLGAQLIAASLGARVFPSGFKEIGWFHVRRTGPGTRASLASLLPERVEVFHWHGDTFDLPRGAERIAQGEVCANQAFAIGTRVLGLQFHLEATPDTVRALAANCRSEIVPGPTIQTEADMLAVPERFPAVNRVMASILDSLLGA